MSLSMSWGTFGSHSWSFRLTGREIRGPVRLPSEQEIKDEEMTKNLFVARLCTAALVCLIAIAGYLNLAPVLIEGIGPPFAITNIKLGAMAGLFISGMMHQRIWGLTRFFKVAFPLGMISIGAFIAITGRPLDSWHMFAVLVFDFIAVMQSDEDESALHGLSIALFLAYVVYVFFHTCSVDGIGPQIHLIDHGSDYDLSSQLLCNIVPVLLNLLLIMSYSRDQRRDSKRSRASVELASQVAKALNNFDLEGAQSLLEERPDSEDLPICTHLEQLVDSLRVFRPFLPNYLFPQNVGNDSDPTHGAVSQAMWGKPTCWDSAATAAMRLRDPEYSLNDFRTDVTAAFPEMQLYSMGSRFSSGRTGSEEYQRTLGALYSVYCIARLDIDGKDILSFGVDAQGKAVRATASAGCDPDEKRHMFYKSMDWDRMLELFIRAGLLLRRPVKTGGFVDKDYGTASGPSSDAAVLHKASAPMSPSDRPSIDRAEDQVLATGTTVGSSITAVSGLSMGKRSTGASGIHVGRTRVRVDVERMTAFLALTAIHDVMKNSSLLPTVHAMHAPYHGIGEGDLISDHDVALMYIMEHFPGLLPSFHGLGPAQRAVVFFTQGKMGFNNGWLVQGEAPPGALFSQFKEVITMGGASDSDISFYFAHWLTDLAGAEPFDERPWPGSEKFALKFPLKVLNAFLDSFTYVLQLSFFSEVQVMEEYLLGRWLALGLTAEAVEGCAVASMRLALMAQGFEAAAVAALEALPAQDRDVLAAELARTGAPAQFDGAPAEVRERPAGPALLVYAGGSRAGPAKGGRGARGRGPACARRGVPGGARAVPAGGHAAGGGLHGGGPHRRPEGADAAGDRRQRALALAADLSGRRRCRHEHGDGRVSRRGRASCPHQFARIGITIVFVPLILLRLLLRLLSPPPPPPPAAFALVLLLLLFILLSHRRGRPCAAGCRREPQHASRRTEECPRRRARCGRSLAAREGTVRDFSWPEV
ncbi:unnamed protein product [Prorocentrum cordatum]|uniref:Uncharacterized protein n=1 Tax=Prorocentrum cordatum TaxID=2364126 RepID=A0ABN9VA58_9DINO|nr:unnamed protein product [Polarella glacialis]